MPNQVTLASIHTDIHTHVPTKKILAFGHPMDSEIANWPMPTMIYRPNNYVYNVHQKFLCVHINAPAQFSVKEFFVITVSFRLLHLIFVCSSYLSDLKELFWPTIPT